MVRTMPCHSGVRLRCSDRPPGQHPPKEVRPSTTPLDDNRPPPGADSAVTSVQRPSSAGRVCLWSAVCRACCEPTQVRDHRSSRDCPRRDTARARAARRGAVVGVATAAATVCARTYGVELRAFQVADANHARLLGRTIDADHRCTDQPDHHTRCVGRPVCAHAADAGAQRRQRREQDSRRCGPRPATPTSVVDRSRKRESITPEASLFEGLRVNCPRGTQSQLPGGHRPHGVIAPDRVEMPRSRRKHDAARHVPGAGRGDIIYRRPAESGPDVPHHAPEPTPSPPRGSDSESRGEPRGIATADTSPPARRR